MAHHFELPLAKVQVIPAWPQAPIGTLLMMTGDGGSGPAIRCDHVISSSNTRTWLVGLLDEDAGSIVEQGQVRDTAIALGEDYELMVCELTPEPWINEKHTTDFGAVFTAPDGSLLLRCHLRKGHRGFAIIRGDGAPGLSMITFDHINGLIRIGQIGIRCKPALPQA